MRPRTLAAATLFLAAAAAPTAAPAQDAQLVEALQRLAGAWAGGDAAAVVAVSAGAGLSFDLGGERVGPLGPRQAAAVLRGVLEHRETISLETSLIRTVGGEPPRAFGELTWTSRARGTTIPERSTVLLELVREGDAWRVTRIRLLP